MHSSRWGFRLQPMRRPSRCCPRPDAVGFQSMRRSCVCLPLKQEDPWNSIMAGAATGGVLQLRTGLRSAAKSAAFGGVLLVRSAAKTFHQMQCNHDIHQRWRHGPVLSCLVHRLCSVPHTTTPACPRHAREPLRVPERYQMEFACLSSTPDSAGRCSSGWVSLVSRVMPLCRR